LPAGTIVTSEPSENVTASAVGDGAR